MTSATPATTPSASRRQNPDYALYLITAPTAAEAAKEFRQLIGPSYIPPKWAFLPYLYSEFMKAALEDAPYFRPLAFDYPAAPDAREVEDQLLLGEGLMIAPIYTQNAHGRTVYLPEPMKLLRLRSVCDYDEEILPAGRHYLACELDEVLLFLRPGHTVRWRSLPPTLPCWTTPPSPSGVLRRTVSLCPTGCTPMTASPPTLISPTTGASSGNKNPRTQPSALPLLQRDAAKLLRHGATKSS